MPIAVSPSQEDMAGMERATGCICLLMSGMPTGTLSCPETSWWACRRASSTAWSACSKCRPAAVCGVEREIERELHRQTCISHYRRSMMQHVHTCLLQSNWGICQVISGISTGGLICWVYRMACGTTCSIDISICLCMLGEMDRYAQIIELKESGEIETCASTCVYMLLRVHL